MPETRRLEATLPVDVEYVSGRVNGVDTVWTNIEGNKWESIVDRSDDDVYFVELTMINSLGVEANHSMTIYYGLHLVTDRTFLDVEQKNEKGTYNASDLNRVISAEEYLIGLFTNMGYMVPYKKIIIDRNGRTIWNGNDIPTESQMKAYIDNLLSIRSAVPQFQGTPRCPESMKKLTHTSANDIEKILEATDRIISLIKRNYYFSDEIYSGEV